MYPSRYALCIGIDTYQDTHFQPLGEAENDAQLIRNALKVYDFQVELLIGKEATRSNISRALSQVTGRAQKDDLLLIYYSGHGAPYHQTASVVPFDADHTQMLSIITLDQLTYSCQSASRHVGFIFDACFSSRVMGIVEKPKSTSAIEKVLDLKTYMALSAASGLADDVQSMTRFVLEELATPIIDETTGLFTFSDLGYQVRRKMLAELGKKQIPQFGHLPDSEGGEIILKADIGPRLPPELLVGLNSDKNYRRAGAAYTLIEIAKSDDNLNSLAIEHLKRIIDSDPDKRVKEIAERYFEETRVQTLTEQSASVGGNQQPLGPVSVAIPGIVVDDSHSALGREIAQGKQSQIDTMMSSAVDALRASNWDAAEKISRLVLDRSPDHGPAQSLLYLAADARKDSSLLRRKPYQSKWFVVSVIALLLVFGYVILSTMSYFIRVSTNQVYSPILTSIAETDIPSASLTRPTEVPSGSDNTSLSTAGSEPPTTEESQELEEFVSDEGGFSVLMPGTPVRESQIINSSYGGLELVTYSVSDQSNGAYYGVSYNDYPGESTDPNAQLDAIGSQILSTPNITLESEQNTALNEFPGRHFIFKQTNPATSIHMRAFLVNKRLYQLIIVFTPGTIELNDVIAFLDSFKLN